MKKNKPIVLEYLEILCGLVFLLGNMYNIILSNVFKSCDSIIILIPVILFLMVTAYFSIYNLITITIVKIVRKNDEFKSNDRIIGDK